MPLLPLLIFFVFVFGAQLWLILILLVALQLAGPDHPRALDGAGPLGQPGGGGGAGPGRLQPAHPASSTSSRTPRRTSSPQLIFFVPAIILAEAGLSFLGLGDPSLPTWGQILEDGFRTGAVFLGYWWWVVSPGLLIVLTAMTFMLLALAMEPIVNPKLRRD